MSDIEDPKDGLVAMRTKLVAMRDDHIEQKRRFQQFMADRNESIAAIIESLKEIDAAIAAIDKMRLR